MAVSMKNVDPAFHGVGHKAGTEIWRIENFQPVPLPKSSYGRFYSGDSYIILRTVILKSGAYHFDIHFWLGKDTTQDEAGAAAIKSVELDAALGGRAVQYRETQGYETQKFLSLFKPCIIPLKGGVASGFHQVEVEEYEPRLFTCKGTRVVQVNQVPFTRGSLNHDDVFVLDTEAVIYQFNGKNSSIQERGKALEVVQYIKDTHHEGSSEVVIVDDGKLGSEADTGQFWSLFGGFAPLAKKAVTGNKQKEEHVARNLLCVVDGSAEVVNNDTELRREMLDSNKCFLIDTGHELFVWTGRNTSLEQRKAGVLAAEEYLAKRQVSSGTLVTKVIEGFETMAFRSNFLGWSLSSDPAVSEDGKSKVAALLRQQGVNMKGFLKSVPTKEHSPPLLSPVGKLQVWRISGDSKTLLSATDMNRFNHTSCYIVQYSYQKDHKDEYFLCQWLGQGSCEGDKLAAARLANDIFLSLKSRPVEAQIIQGSEPPQFLALFDCPLIFTRDAILGLEEEKTIMMQVGAISENYRAVEVEPVATSLNSSTTFVLQSGNKMYAWYGNSSITEEQKAALRVAEVLKSGAPVKTLKEGSEPAAFWSALGGKDSYPSQQDSKVSNKDPKLFVCIFTEGKLKVSEVFNFSQEDLLTEDVMILDTETGVHVWVGQHSSADAKQQGFNFGQEYIVGDVTSAGSNPHRPIIKIPEGHEPAFFTTFFSWDEKKLVVPSHQKNRSSHRVHGDTYERKLAALQSQSTKKHRIPVSANGASPQRATAMLALSSAFAALTPKLGRGNALGKSSSPRTSESPRDDDFVHIHSGSSQKGSAMKALSSVFDSVTDSSGLDGDWVALSSPAMKVEALSDLESPSDLSTENSENAPSEQCVDSIVLSYESLKSRSANPASGINPTKRESYLSPAEFQKVFGMNRTQFYTLPKWKQDQRKKGLDLF